MDNKAKASRKTPAPLLCGLRRGFLFREEEG